MPGRAEELFARFVDQGVLAIDSLIENRQAEELFLDFKRSADNGEGRNLHANDRRSLAKAISGFGNSEGGVVVWGVDCRDTAEQGDVAQAKIPILNPNRFKSRLEGAVSGTTVPPHPGVRHHVVDDGNERGFVITLIPQSYLRPHQEIQGKRYYIRAGSDFSPAPHGVLLGMFGRGPIPDLFHMWAIEGAERRSIGDARTVQVRVGFMLASRGPGIARDLYLSAAVSPPGPRSQVEFGLAMPDDWDGRIIPGQGRISMVSRAGYGIPPDSFTTALYVTVRFAPPFESPWQWTVSFGHGDSPNQRIQGVVPPSRLDELFRGCFLQPPALNDHDFATQAFGVPPEDERGEQ